MNIFDKITLKYLWKNKIRTIVTIIGIILSSAMVCAVTTSVSSLQNYAIQNAIYNEGDWHGSAEDADWKTWEEISSSKEVAHAVYARRLGYAPAVGSENEYKPYFYVLGAGPEFEKVMPVRLISGAYPSSGEEILLPDHLTSNGGLSYQIGDTLTLDLGDRFLDEDILGQYNPCYSYGDDGEEVLLPETFVVRESRTYTVSGFYERPSFEEYTAPGFTVITLEDQRKDQDASLDIYFKMKNPDDVYAFQNAHGLYGTTNTTLLMYSGTSRYDTFTRVLRNFAVIVIVLIMFGSISLIYNAFSISVSERTRQFGLLSSVGSTKKQLRRMVFFEALCVSAVGIPLGIAAGVGGIGVTLLLIGNKFMSIGNFPVPMRICVSPGAIWTACAISLVTVLISAWIPSRRAAKVSAVEAIRQTMDIKAEKKPARTSKLTYKLFGISGVLAGKYYRRSRKKYRITIASLFMSIVLFVSASAFTDYLTESVSGSFLGNGYDISYRYWDEEEGGTPAETLFPLLKDSDGVKKAALVRRSSFEAEVPEKYIEEKSRERLFDQGVVWDERERDGQSVFSIQTELYFVNDEEFLKLLEENGLSKEEYMNPESPLGIPIDETNVFFPSEGKYMKIHFLNTDYAEMTILAEKETDVSDTSEDTDRQGESGETDGYESSFIRLGKRLSNTVYFVENSFECLSVVYPRSLMEEVLGDISFGMKTSYFYFISDDHEASCQEMKKILEQEQISSGSLFDYAETEEEERNIVLIVQVFAYGFIVLISLIAAANVFHTISTNVSLRRREFAMLRSVGMTESGLNRMMNFECLLYGSRALLWGLPVSGVFTYYIYRSVATGYETIFHLPWKAIGIATFSVFAVVFVTMMYSMHKIKKENLIDALKNENL